MRQTIKLFTLLLATTLTVACSSDDDRDNSTAGQNINRNDASQEPALQRLEFPKVKGGNSRVQKLTIRKNV